MNSQMMKYNGNPKHKNPWQPGKKGSLCPKDICGKKAQQLLESSIEDDGKRYGTFEGKAFCAVNHGEDEWHGFPVGWREVPEKIRIDFINRNLVKRSEIAKGW